MNYLGIDYGAAQTGIAVSTGLLAEPLTTVNTEKALQSLKPLVNKYDIDGIVVGNCPKSFLAKLSELSPVHQVDETLSSHEARQLLLHTSQKKRRLTEHAAAAAVMLQDWLDSRGV